MSKFGRVFLKGKCFGEPAEASRVGRMCGGPRAAFGLQKNDASPTAHGLLAMRLAWAR